MLNYVVMVKMVRNGIYIQDVFVRYSLVLFGCLMFWLLNIVKIDSDIISGVINCMMLMFMFFRLLFRFSALFCFCFGKKKLMFVILDVKFVLVKLYSREMMMKML